MKSVLKYFIIISLIKSSNLMNKGQENPEYDFTRDTRESRLFFHESKRQKECSEGSICINNYNLKCRTEFFDFGLLISTRLKQIEHLMGLQLEFIDYLEYVNLLNSNNPQINNYNEHRKNFINAIMENKDGLHLLYASICAKYYSFLLNLNYSNFNLKTIEEKIEEISLLRKCFYDSIISEIKKFNTKIYAVLEKEKEMVFKISSVDIKVREFYIFCINYICNLKYC